VDGHGQLDDAEVRPEVPAGLRDLLDQEATDLVGELRELLLRESVQVARDP
jgi:hypothetical protein